MGARREVTAVLVDIGNTQTRWAAWRGGAEDPRTLDWARRDELAGLADLDRRATHGAQKESLAAAIRATIENPELPLVVASVVPEALHRLQNSWPQLRVADHRCRLPFGCDVPDLAAVGADRLCNLAAASGLGLKDALVVDAGTATTFDLLLDGVFRGGLIAPGMASAAQALGQRAARLEPVPFGPCALEVGRNTTDAMARGAFHTGVGGVAAVVDGLIGVYGPLPVIATGGLADHVPGRAVFRDPHWTLRGAALLAF